MVTLFKREVPLPQPSGNQRSEERLLVNLPVEITRFDPDGNVLIEQTTIEDITSIGCRFTTQVEIHRGDIISIRPLAAGQESLAKSEPQPFEVMWASKLGGRWTTGAKKLESLRALKFLWQATLPQAHRNSPPQNVTDRAGRDSALRKFTAPKAQTRSRATALLPGLARPHHFRQ